jgi:hypothetical protein
MPKVVRLLMDAWRPFSCRVERIRESSFKRAWKLAAFLAISGGLTKPVTLLGLIVERALG